MDENLPELVRDYKLKTWYDQGVIIHEHYDPDISPSAGPRQEKWKKVRTLGSGSQGVIDLEECVGGSRYFAQRAVKKIRLQNKDTNKIDGAKRRYQRELATMVRFSHDRYSKYFVKSLGWFASSTKLYIVMEYFPAGDLFNYVQDYQSLSENDGREIASQIVSGLFLMHSEGYSHRDIKPHNILIHQHPNGVVPGAWWVKLADFGISKCLGRDSTLTTVSIGTAAYMAPELFQYEGVGSSSNDYRPADVWALGVTIYFILTGRVPFQDMVSTIHYANSYGQHFPHNQLDDCQVSQDGQAFIRQAMTPRLQARLELDEAMSHAWICRLVPSFQNPGVISRRSSFNNAKGLTTEMSTLATQRSFGGLGNVEKPEYPTSKHGETLKTTAGLKLKLDRQGSEPPMVNQQQNSWIQLVNAVHKGNIKDIKALLSRYDGRSKPLNLSAQEEEVSLATLLKNLPEGHVNVPDGGGRTPIMFAAISGHVPLTKLLISAGADPGWKDDDFKTALHLAVDNGHEIVVRHLLEIGVDVEVSDAYLSTPLLRAAEMGHEDILKLLLDRGANIEVKDQNSWTPLFWAAYEGYESAAKFLIDAGANLESKNGMWNWTPLRMAIRQQNKSIISLLIQEGAQRSWWHYLL